MPSIYQLNDYHAGCDAVSAGLTGMTEFLIKSRRRVNPTTTDRMLQEKDKEDRQLRSDSCISQMQLPNG
jgi:hypothetical protein